MKHLKIKKWTTKIGILVLLTVFSFLESCLDRIIEAPTFVVSEITLRPRSMTEANLLIALDVQNPNRFDLILKSFEYVLLLTDKEIRTGHIEKEIRLLSLSTTQVKGLVVAKFKDLGGILKAIVSGHEMDYKIEGKASIGTAFGSRDFVLSKDGRTNPLDL